MGLTQVNSDGVSDGSIKNADIKSDAAIAKSKLAGLDIVNADINASAAIATSKISGLATSATTDTTNAANIGSGTLPAARIGNDSIAEVKLDISNGPGDGKFLQYKDDTDKLTWATVSTTTDFASLTDTTVSTSDPVITTNPSATGHVWVNKSTGATFICSDNTSNANHWKNVKGSGNIIPQYSVDFLVLAGGGSGGWGGYGDASGGGGAGGLRQSWNNETSGGGGSSESAITVNIGTQYTVTVGAGGSDAKGGDSSISGTGLTTITSNGGGKGNGRSDASNNSGGCGGGWAYLAFTGGTGTANQGYDGATGGSGTQPGGAGGGTGGAGSGGTGGALTNSTITGSTVGYGRGGFNEASGGSRAAGADGLGEGGNGSDGDPWGNGGDGGDGVVILRMATSNYNSSGVSGTHTVSTSGSDTIIKFTGNGSYTA